MEDKGDEWVTGEGCGKQPNETRKAAARGWRNQERRPRLSLPLPSHLSPLEVATMTRRAPHVSLWLLVGVLHAGVAVAQAPRVQPAFPSFHASLAGETSTQQPPAQASKRTYWLEGGVIGAVVLGVTAYFVEKATASTLCSDTGGAGCHDYRTVAIVGGAALGFVIGALIGKGHEKAGPAESTPN